MRKYENLKHSNTGTVHASGCKWRPNGPMCRSITSMYEVVYYVETDDKVTCKTCIGMLQKIERDKK